MLFNSLVFVVFFPVVWGIWRGLPAAREGTEGRPERTGLLRRLWLLAASLFFYGWWDWRFLALLLLTASIDWACGRLLDPERELAPARRRAVLTVSIVSNLGVLGVFKYLGFFTRELAALLSLVGVTGSLPVLEVVLPVGLSFYTFQAIGYNVDVYRGTVKACRSWVDFVLFISFFPHLVAGPIQRSHLLIPQIVRPKDPTPAQLAEGAQLALWGFFKKVVVADNLAPLVGHAFDGTPRGGFATIVAAYAFTWQIYCDFSGYSDIARGLAKWLGVELILNFHLPLFADSPRDLWRRWHVSLSEWLRDYLYVPLGGNRSHPRRNLILTMVLGGLWHGANWTFVVWGLWHGIALAVHRSRASWPVPRWLGILGTFHLTCLGFVVFRAHSLGQVVDLARRVLADPLPRGGQDLADLHLFALLVTPVLFNEALQFFRGDTWGVPRLGRVAQVVWSILLLTAIWLLGATAGQEFIYFQF